MALLSRDPRDLPRRRSLLRLHSRDGGPTLKSWWTRESDAPYYHQWRLLNRIVVVG